MSFDPIILYLHIPKAGGSTTSDLIYDQLHTHNEYVEEDGSFCSGIFYYPSGFVKDLDSSLSNRIQRVLRRSDLRAVVGHFCFGIHRYLLRSWAYVTLLRNPLDRVISLYYFQKLVEEKWGKLEGIKMRKGMSLEEFVAEPLYKEVDNGQTRRISGLDPEIGRCMRFTLERAKENLRQQFSVVGVTERFDETLILLKRTFGWTKELLYYPKNVNPRRPLIASFPKEAVDAIIERNKLDFELYEFAKEMLDELISSQDITFHDEVENFKSLKQSWYESITTQQSKQDRP